MAIGPAERRLKHLMKLGEIEVHGQFERAGNRRLNANDVDFGTDNEGIGFEHDPDNVAQLRPRQPSTTIRLRSRVLPRRSFTAV